MDVGCTVTEPTRVEVLESAPLLIRTEEALLMFQLRVEVPADATTVGAAEKDETVGKAALWVVALAFDDVADVRPNVSYAETA